ncbi:glycosyltransferase [Amphritea sp.]|uniref:glycosyltransferase n=1 Tax=Amphritea sp. TaxID=1872502 RepID=UPI0025B831B0|nr:glycosyltransferase [Amphritea sp.]
MIFVTVGTQLPFERLIQVVDDWASKNPKVEVFAQIGQTRYVTTNIITVVSMTPDEYEQKLSEADVIIGHVGMGTIISGVKYGKPLILMPRHADKGEHRNDHQLSTAKQFGKLSLVSVVDSYKELELAIEQTFKVNAEAPGEDVLSVSATLINTISNFVKGI